MSYDYYVLKLTRDITYLNELGPTTVADLGSWSEVRQQVSSVIPGIEWEDWLGHLRTDHGWMEFSIPKEQPLDHGFTIHTSHRSDHQWEEGVVQELCRVFGWCAVDPQGVGTYRLIDASGLRQLQGEPGRVV